MIVDLIVAHQQQSAIRRAVAVLRGFKLTATSIIVSRNSGKVTNAHSKKTRNHDAMPGLCFAWYNWCRKHMTIRTTPAMATGIATEPWTLADLLTAASAA